MELHICMHHGCLELFYILLYSHGKLFLYSCRYYLYQIASTFYDVLIPNPPYFLSGGLYHLKILIFPEYNLLTYLLLGKFQMLMYTKFQTTVHLHQPRFA